MSDTQDASAPMAMGTIEGRQSSIVRASVIGIVANLALAAFKAVVGIVSNSIAVTLDAVNNLSDALSSVITIVGTKLASKPADRKHPYGHGRIEYLTTTIIAGIILYAGGTSLVESVRKIIHPEAADYSMVALLIIAVAVVVKLVLGRYVTGVGRKVSSDTLVASGSDALFDAVLSSSVLAAAVIYMAFGVSLEAWVGVIIAVVIIKSGIEMLSDAISEVLGQRVTPELSNQVKAIVRSVPGVLGAYDLMLHSYGPEQLVGSVHVEVPDTMTAGEIDVITRSVEEHVLRETNGTVLIVAVGIYSHNTHNDEAAAIERAARAIVEGHEGILQMHGFYVDQQKHYMRMDAVVTFESDRDQIRRELIDELRKRFPDYQVWLTLDIDVSD
jgi:cation diffusion facilitator family transporter